MALAIDKRIREATRPDMVQVAPGRYIPRTDAVQVPGVTLARYEALDDGGYAVKPFQERMIRMTPELLDLLGLGDRTRRTLLRLGRAGFLEVLQISPRCFMLNLDSYFGHLRRVAEDPWFWENEQNRRAYMDIVLEV